MMPQITHWELHYFHLSPTLGAISPPASPPENTEVNRVLVEVSRALTITHTSWSFCTSWFGKGEIGVTVDLWNGFMCEGGTAYIQTVMFSFCSVDLWTAGERGYPNTSHTRKDRGA